MAHLNSLWLTLLGSLYILGAVAQNYAITNYIVSGSGCVPSSVSADLSDDGKNIALSYDNFVASAGPSFDYDDNRKNCQLTLSVKVPAGYQFAFDRFNHTASYSISSGVKANFSSTYYFQASLDEGKGSSSIFGPAKYDGSVAQSYGNYVWSPCSQNVLVGINTAARVDNSANSGASGSLTIRNTPSYSFIWRTC